MKNALVYFHSEKVLFSCHFRQYLVIFYRVLMLIVRGSNTTKNTTNHMLTEGFNCYSGAGIPTKGVPLGEPRT